MSPPTTLLLLRHGETEANAAGILQGQSESDLTARGRRQAQLLGAALRPRIDRVRETLAPLIYSSDLRRAVDTAQAVADGVGGESTPLTLKCDERLRERRLGPFQGIPPSECARLFPRAWAAFNRGELDHADGRGAALEPDADGVETVDSMRTRAIAALDEIASSHPPGSTILLVSHGGLVFTAVMACSPSDGSGAPIAHIGNCSVTTLQRADGVWRVESVGEVLAREEGEAVRSDARNVDMASAQGSKRT